MSERKVLNKYYPPNFDPSKIPRRRQPKNADVYHEVRLMTPFSMRCNTCGEYIYKGKKFNAKKRTVEGESYYRIKIYRFYIRCPGCSAEITFKTDPGSMDYVAESGAMRNFEPWRDEEKVSEQSQLQRLEEEELNPIKALENKTMDAKKEMEIMEALDEIRTRNARNEQVKVDAVLHRLEQQKQQQPNSKIDLEAEAEDDALAKSIFQSKPSLDGKYEPVVDLATAPASTFATSTFSSSLVPSKRKKEDKESAWSHLVTKKKPPAASSSASTSSSTSSASSSSDSRATLALGLAYDSDNESS